MQIINMRVILDEFERKQLPQLRSIADSTEQLLTLLPTYSYFARVKNKAYQVLRALISDARKVNYNISWSNAFKLKERREKELKIQLYVNELAQKLANLLQLLNTARAEQGPQVAFDAEADCIELHVAVQKFIAKPSMHQRNSLHTKILKFKNKNAYRYYTMSSIDPNGHTPFMLAILDGVSTGAWDKFKAYVHMPLSSKDHLQAVYNMDIATERGFTALDLLLEEYRLKELQDVIQNFAIDFLNPVFDRFLEQFYSYNAVGDNSIHTFILIKIKEALTNYDLAITDIRYVYVNSLETTLETIHNDLCAHAASGEWQKFDALAQRLARYFGRNYCGDPYTKLARYAIQQNNLSMLEHLFRDQPLCRVCSFYDYLNLFLRNSAVNTNISIVSFLLKDFKSYIETTNDTTLNIRINKHYLTEFIQHIAPIKDPELFDTLYFELKNYFAKDISLLKHMVKHCILHANLYAIQQVQASPNFPAIFNEDPTATYHLSDPSAYVSELFKLISLENLDCFKLLPFKNFNFARLGIDQARVVIEIILTNAARVGDIDFVQNLPELLSIELRDASQPKYLTVLMYLELKKPLDLEMFFVIADMLCTPEQLADPSIVGALPGVASVYTHLNDASSFRFSDLTKSVATFMAFLINLDLKQQIVNQRVYDCGCNMLLMGMIDTAKHIFPFLPHKAFNSPRFVTLLNQLDENRQLQIIKLCASNPRSGIFALAMQSVTASAFAALAYDYLQQAESEQLVLNHLQHEIAHMRSSNTLKVLFMPSAQINIVEALLAEAKKLPTPAKHANISNKLANIAYQYILLHLEPKTIAALVTDERAIFAAANSGDGLTHNTILRYDLKIAQTLLALIDRYESNPIDNHGLLLVINKITMHFNLALLPSLEPTDHPGWLGYANRYDQLLASGDFVDEEIALAQTCMAINSRIAAIEQGLIHSLLQKPDQDPESSAIEHSLQSLLSVHENIQQISVAAKIAKMRQQMQSPTNAHPLVFSQPVQQPAAVKPVPDASPGNSLKYRKSG